MIFNDTIYGEVVISEPVLHDLIQSGAVQRLHGVLQALPRTTIVTRG